MPKEDGVERGFVSRYALHKDALSLHVVQVKEMFLDVLAAAADSVVTAEDVSAAVPITCTIAAQPDVPRTLSWVITHTNITNFTLAILGVDAKGNKVTETFSQADGWSGETDAAFATVTSVTLSARTGTGATDTLNVGVGSKLGLANPLHSASSVSKVTKNKADYPDASFTVDATNDTVDVSTGAAIVADDDFCITYRMSVEQEDL